MCFGAVFVTPYCHQPPAWCQPSAFVSPGRSKVVHNLATLSHPEHWNRSYSIGICSCSFQFYDASCVFSPLKKQKTFRLYKLVIISRRFTAFPKTPPLAEEAKVAISPLLEIPAASERPAVPWAGEAVEGREGKQQEAGPTVLLSQRGGVRGRG